ncbi:hypothetical protein PRUPE_5G028900 [Prunus persica]|uniref:Uncharacterized protein n=1 Tax=Prunus persica TaxID=3760 RepID=A0A251P300_PRUPE|nr:hypothetical protein PRUPE_5G028900 [Prunus persica]
MKNLCVCLAIFHTYHDLLVSKTKSKPKKLD